MSNVSASTAQTVTAKFTTLEEELNGIFFERKQLIRGMLIALLSREHLFVLGPPGTGKSDLIDSLAARLGVKTFKKVVSPHTTPEDLVGPISVVGLQQDQYHHNVTAMLPEAKFAFLDEIWKMNSATLNYLLPIMNEREMQDGNVFRNIPLEVLMTASNEVPGDDREEVQAAIDRFLMWFQVSYIQDPAHFGQFLAKKAAGQKAQVQVTLTEQDVDQARQEVSQIDLAEVLPMLSDLWGELRNLNHPVSDRRWGQMLKVIRAEAWLNGHAKATDTDVRPVVSTLWTDPKQESQMRQVVEKFINPFDQQAMTVSDEALEVYRKASAVPKLEDPTQLLDAVTKQVAEGFAKLRRVLRDLDTLAKQAKAQKRATNGIDSTKTTVQGWIRSLAAIEVDVMASVANGAYHAALGAPKSKQTEAASEANVLFKRVSAALESLPTDTGMAEMGAIATEQVSKVRDLSKEVLNKCMGF